MAIYTCTTQEGTLSAEQRAVIAAEITRIHSTHTGEPASFVWVIFETVSPDSTFIGGKPDLNGPSGGVFREDGRTQTKTKELKENGSMFKNSNGLLEGQLLGWLTEISPGDAKF